MTENNPENRPLLWLVDSEQAHLAARSDAFEPWADCVHIAHDAQFPDWDNPPDAVFFSAEIPGGANGPLFRELVDNAGPTPLLAVARLRSLAQAVAYFRAGAADYLSFPIEEEDVRDRFAASLERAARLAMQNMIMEVEPVDDDATENSEQPPVPEPEPAQEQEQEREQDQEQEEDILAHVQPPPRTPARTPSWVGAGAYVNDMPLPLAFSAREDEPAPALPDPPAPAEPDDDEPIAVDGLPIPTLWEELPCGLLVFDSLGNLVFSNRLGLELLGHDTLAELQDALENGLASFAAHGANHKPYPDNQWPHLLAVKTRAPRSAVVSIEKRDKRRAWLRIDCQPHVSDGKIARLSMTVVNLTGELPPLQTQDADKPSPLPPARKDKKDKAKRRGGKKA